ncbi:hypothetical protein [Streptomyces sp. ME19-01-6]|uniref:hypothetical protein n=1 Tax=Streptomyces sp. ME19-01-6 TaxID=3028686 RepID=UPI0029AAA3BB|nr:hypothetical protein [Streptomyces sp. ME19-01-6]MDX3232485.1 hypothetical protein [Streptomyces sp. ME19-01-6]
MTEDDFDGRLTVGTVILTQDPEGSGWSANCRSCPWTDLVGPLGFQGINSAARQHSTQRHADRGAIA